MAILRKMVTYTDYRWEVLDEVEFDLKRDKCLEDSEYPELIEEDGE